MTTRPEPTVSDQPTRGELIAWLTWNDLNGCYSDTDSTLEGYEPLTLDELIAIRAEILEPDTPADDDTRSYGPQGNPYREGDPEPPLRFGLTRPIAY